ncbi:MAG TPA: hypothetical protein VFW11_20635, partial [Cyclobacteriaceae bacterium]|nr:hypothetical protein [Cyclobacteriaceae bacterium]
MEKGIKIVSLFLLTVALATSCKDKEAEKRIAQLESRIAELEGKNTAPTSTVQPAAAPVQEEKPDGPLPVLSFETMEHDFGTINEGDVVEYTY